MSSGIILLSLALAAAAAIVVARLIARSYLKNRGARVVTCPETHQPAGVAVDAGHAALTALLGKPELRLQSCSRWPEKASCGRECLAEIEAAPEGCLVRNLLSRWYEGRKCVYCGKPIEIHWADHRPALLGPDQKTVPWPDVPAETVPEALHSHQPVCWNCHVVTTVMREHPELVTTRSWRP